MNNREFIQYELQKNNTDFISGEILAEKLGISRAAVSKIIKEMKDDGIEIESTTNKGYKLLSGDIVSSQLIKDFLTDKDYEINIFKDIDSTNLEAKRILTKETSKSKRIIISNSQNLGRGRLGRTFFSPKNSGIYMTVILPTNLSIEKAGFVTIATGVAICRAIEALTDFTPKIKWVNDIFIEDRKIGGILTEATSNFETGLIENLIIGIGINFDSSQLPEEVSNIADSLFNKKRQNKNKINRNILIASIVNELKILDLINGETTHQLIDTYKSYSNILGKNIKVHIGSQESYAAIACDINELGHLIVKRTDNNEISSLSFGEVSIRF